MHDNDKLKRYYDALELDMGADARAVREAHRRLKKLLTSDSIALIPAVDELGDEHKAKMLADIDDACRHLTAELSPGDVTYSDRKRRFSEDDVQEFVLGLRSHRGDTFRTLRGLYGLTLEDVARSIKVGERILADIEGENFSALPPPVYLKSFVGQYAEYLRLDPARASADYMRAHAAGGAQG